jgi:hypothetical protein
MPTLQERRDAGKGLRVAHLLVIEGSSLIFTDAPSLAGTTYITDGREIIPGLELPSAIKMGINPREGLLKEYSSTFKVTDTKTGQVASLFRGIFDDANADQLALRVPPTLDPMVNPSATVGGTINPFGKHIGIEKIGPAGERRYWGIHPGVTPAPFDHAHLGDPGSNEHLAPIVISDEARVWAGRHVALHELIWDPYDEDWDTWTNQYTAGSMIWRGTLQGRGQIVNTSQFEIKCFGPASLLRRRLNRTRSTTPIKVLPKVDATDNQKLVALIPHRRVYNNGDFGFNSNYQSSIFESAYDLTATTNDALLQELSTFFDDVIDGTTSNYAGTGNTSNRYYSEDVSSPAYSSSSNSLGISSAGLSITYKDEATPPGHIGGRASICMHEKFWSLLGFDPSAQDALEPEGGHPYYVKFFQLEPFVTEPTVGIDLTSHRTDIADAEDWAGYWVAEIQTMSWFNASATPDNNGTAVKYEALFPNGVASISPYGKQEIALDSTAEIFVPSQKAFPPGRTYGEAELRPSIGVNQVNSMGWFLLEGQLARGLNQFADVEFEDFAQVARCSWYSSGNGGIASGAGNDNPTMIIECLEDPRAFGFEHERITAPWLTGGTAELTATPLAVLAFDDYADTDTYPDAAYGVISRLLLSSGTSGAWGTTGEPTYPSVGDNHPSVSGFSYNYVSDQEISDLGLNIEGVAVDIASFRTLRDETLDGAGDPLGLVKLAYRRPFQAEEALGSLLQGRGWCMGYKRLSGYVQPKFTGIDLYAVPDPASTYGSGGSPVTIGESDLAGDAANNASWVPRVQQTWRSTIDAFELSTRGNLDGGGYLFEDRYLAMDSGAPLRHGASVLSIKDAGLSNPRLFAQGSAPDSEYQWEPGFRARWQKQIAEFMAKPNRTVTLTVSAPKGQYLYPGTAFRLTNAAINGLDGQSVGVTNAPCMVLETVAHKRGKLAGHYTITALMYGVENDFGAVWGGSANATSIVDNGGGSFDLVCAEDWTSSGHGGNDVSAFAAPAWTSLSGTVTVKIYQSFDRKTFPSSDAITADVTSVNTGTDTVVINNLSGTLYADTYKIVTLAAWTDQTAGNWSEELPMWHTDGQGTTHTSGEAGKKLI